MENKQDITHEVKVDDLSRKAKEMFDQGNYPEAIKYLTQFIALNPQYTYAYLIRGGIYLSLSQYDNALTDYNAALEIDSTNYEIYSSKGFVYLLTNQYDEALINFNKALEINPSIYKSYLDRAQAYLLMERFNDALVDFDKAFEINSTDVELYAGRGLVYMQMKQYDKAIVDLIAAIKSKPDHERAYRCYIGICNLEKKFVLQAADVFVTYGKKEVLDILTDYPNVDKELIDAMLNVESENNSFYTTLQQHQANKNSPYYEQYKKIYLQSLKTIRQLHVDNALHEQEQGVAHYTQRVVAEYLLLTSESKRSTFRLSSIVTANDPEEGNVLLSYLDLDKKECGSDNQAFIACFTFNHDSLNQFRLYGKTGGQEGTGVSIVVGKEFFTEKAEIQKGKGKISFPLQLNKESGGDDDKSTAVRHNLFRCVYFDPVTKQIISLGQKEPYIFYRDNLRKLEQKEITIEEIEREIEAYNKAIAGKTTEVKKAFSDLSKLINKRQNKELDKELLADLLLELRYLVKHVAFKEEQECRIIRVERLTNNEKLKVAAGNNSMYYDTGQDISGYVRKMYFGPRAAGMELFQDMLKQEGLMVKCHKCSHPYAHE